MAQRRNKSFTFFLIFSLFLVICSHAHSLAQELLTQSQSFPAQVEDLSGPKYLPRVKETLRNAKRSIYMVMYLVTFDPNDKQSPVSVMVDELISARERGVNVKVVLDSKPGSQQENEALFLFLKEHGIEAYYDTRGTVTHTKAIIIDDTIVILGSANWSKSSFNSNGEVSCLINSPEFASSIRGYFSTIELSNVATVSQPSAGGIRVRKGFLADPKLLPKIVSGHDNTALDLYLFLLRKYSANPVEPIEVDYKKLYEEMGYSKKISYRSCSNLLSGALNRLEQKYNLITVQRRYAPLMPLVRLLDYPGTASYSAPKDNFITIPKEYWQYGWDNALKLNEKFAFFILLTQCAGPGECSWKVFCSQLSKEFNTPLRSIMSGMKGLRIYDIVDIEYPYIMPGILKHEKEPTTFTLKGLYSPVDFEREKQLLIALHGKGRFERAQNYARIVFDGNNLQVIGDILQKIDEYGQKAVSRAFSVVAGKSSDNPKRSYGYVIGILKQDPKQGSRKNYQ